MSVTKPRRTRDTQKDGDVSFRDMWVKKTARGKTCTKCMEHIYGGEYSLRYICKNAKSVKKKDGTKFKIGVERAICTKCATSRLKEMIMALEQPRDEEAYCRALEREKEGSSRNSEW